MRNFKIYVGNSIRNTPQRFTTYAHYSDDQRVWKQSKKEDEQIRKLVDEIGEDALELYKMYGQKAGVMEMVKV